MSTIVVIAVYYVVVIVDAFYFWHYFTRESGTQRSVFENELLLFLNSRRGQEFSQCLETCVAVCTGKANCMMSNPCP